MTKCTNSNAEDLHAF